MKLFSHSRNLSCGQQLCAAPHIDASAHELTIVNHDHPRAGAVRFAGLPTRVCLAVQSPKHSMRATITMMRSIPSTLKGYKAPLVVRKDGGEKESKLSKQNE